MKKLFSVLIFLFTVSVLFSQTKYLVYFKDKGISPSTRLLKSSALFEAAAKELSPRAIERRKQVMGENYITYVDLPLNESYIEQVESIGIKVVHKLKWFNAISCYLTAEQLNEVKLLPSVKKVEEVKKYSVSMPIEKEVSNPVLNKTSSTKHFLDYGASLTQNELSEIPEVHDVGLKGSDVIIGILDTGFRWKSVPSLVTRKVIAEYDFIQNDSVTANQTGDASSQDNHGTEVFSIIGGYASGDLIGPAYGASFVLAKTEYVPSETNVEEDNYAAALEWMEGLGVDITTSSLGYRTFDAGQHSYTYEDMDGKTTLVAQAANLAFDRGISTFTAAGNEGMDLISSPGDAFNIITVGAVDKNNLITSYSSRGPTFDGRIKPEVVAMGTGVRYAVAGTSSYSSLYVGTSFATPIAAGIAGLLKSAFPYLTNVQIRQIFLQSGDNTASPNNEVGYGLISAKKAITYPNLSEINNQLTLHKIFINDAGVKPSSVKLNYQIGNSDFQTTTVTYDSSLEYSYEFPLITQGQKVQFNFTYNTDSGTEVREPEGLLNYSFVYGNENIVTDAENKKEIPEQFQLMQNYPNPFNPETTISYSIPVETLHPAKAGQVATYLHHVLLKVYDVLGREVSTLVDAYQQAGTYKVTLDGSHAEHGRSMASGVYFYRLTTSSYSETKKMILLR